MKELSRLGGFVTISTSDTMSFYFSMTGVQHTLNSHIHQVEGVEYRVIIAIGMPFS